MLAGLAGSLHCVGMCGGLVSSTCHQRSDIWKYQIGRLIGYLFLGLVAAAVGSYFKDVMKHPILSYAPTFMVGGLFIYWGVMSYLGKSTTLFKSKFLSQSYQVLWKKLGLKNSSLTRSFLVGLISILLPCGLLYGVILSTLAMQDVTLAVLSILFFWMGTLPAMIVAPEIFRNVLLPFQQHRPKLYAVSLMLIGILTLSYRFYGQIHPSSEACQCHVGHQ